jgi:hypothetical protein
MKIGRLGFGLAVVTAVSLGTAARADIRFTETIRTADGEVRREILLRADRRRIETKPVEWKGGPGTDARLRPSIEITRLDRQETWRLDPDAKRYETLPLRRASGSGRSAADPSQDLLHAHYRPGEAEISVGRPAGAREAGGAGKIAGFATERVRLKRVVSLRSASTAREAHLELVMDAWITRDPRLLAEVSRFEGGDGPGTSESLVPIRTRSGALIGGLAPQVAALNAKLRTLGGYPLNASLTVTWESPDASAKRHAARPSVGTMAIEVTAVSFETLADSAFEIPADYQLAGAPARAPAAAPARTIVPPVAASTSIAPVAAMPLPTTAQPAPAIAATPPATEPARKAIAVPAAPSTDASSSTPPTAVSAARSPSPSIVPTPASTTGPRAAPPAPQPVAAPAAVPASPPGAAALKPGGEGIYIGTAADEPGKGSRHRSPRGSGRRKKRDLRHARDMDE